MPLYFIRNRECRRGDGGCFFFVFGELWYISMTVINRSQGCNTLADAVKHPETYENERKKRKKKRYFAELSVLCVINYVLYANTV